MKPGAKDEGRLAGTASGLESADTVDGGVLESAATLDAPDSDRVHTPQPELRGLPRGKLVGRYVVLDTLGEGGMGVVYRAYDPELDRQTALKVLRLRGPDVTAARDRLRREAQAMARVTDVHVRQVYDVGTVEGRLFLAMELIDGATLTEWLAAESRSWRAVRDVLVAAGKGLVAAHRAGLVHRDFKPTNVLVAVDGRVCVADFGLARSAVAAEPASGETPAHRTASVLDTTLTVGAGFVGTPRYMAPEQHRGASDARTDQFAFCVTAWEAFYDQLPFGGDSLDERVEAIRAGNPQAPPKSAVPSRIRRALERGLRAEPDQRFPSMDGLLAALAADPEKTRRRWLLGGLGGAAAAAAIILAVAGGDRDAASQVCQGADRKLATAWNDEVRARARAAFAATDRSYATDSWRRVEQTIDRYGDAWVHQRQQACEATRIHGEQSEALLDLRMHCLDQRLGDLAALTEVLASADGPVVENAVAAARDLPDLAECADTEQLTQSAPLPQDPAVRERIADARRQLAVARATTQAGKYDAALPIAEAVVSRATDLGFRPLEAEALEVLGRDYVGTGNEEEAARTYVRALAAAHAGHQERIAAIAAVRLIHAEGVELARPEAGHRWNQLAAGLIEGIGGDPALELERATQLSALYRRQGDAERALSLLEESVHRAERAGLDSDLALATAYNGIGGAAYMLGRYDTALAQFEHALQLREAILGRDHPTVSGLLVNIGTVLYSRGRHDAAAERYRRVLPILEEKLGPDHPTVAIALNNLGLTLATAGKHAEALPYLERALAIREARRGADHPDVATTLLNLAVAYRGLGRYDDALAADRRALSIYQAAEGADHPDCAYALTGVGLTQLERRDPGRARASLERALRIRERGDVDPTDLAETRFALARALADDERDRAVELARAARETYAASAADNPYRAKLTEEVDAWLEQHGVTGP